MHCKCKFAKFRKSCKIVMQLIKYALHFAKCEARICSLNYYFSFVLLKRTALSKKWIIWGNTTFVEESQGFYKFCKLLESQWNLFWSCCIVCSVYRVNIFQAQNTKSNKGNLGSSKWHVKMVSENKKWCPSYENTKFSFITFFAEIIWWFGDLEAYFWR